MVGKFGLGTLSRRTLMAGAGLAVVMAGVLGGQAVSAAEHWPHDTVTMIVPFKPGGSVDRLARFLAPALSEALGVNVRVDNRPGGKGQIGYQQVQAAPDDGSVFVLGVDPYLSAAISGPNPTFTLDDWAFVAVQENDPISVTVHRDSRFNSLGELIEAARSAPDTITIGVPSGGGPQLQLETIAAALGNFPFREVTYEGSTYRNALLGQHVDAVFSSASGDLAIKDDARVIAIATDDEFPGWEDAQSINAALEPYGVVVPYIGAIRFVAFRASFRDNNPELWDTFIEAYKNAVNSEAFQANITRSGEIVVTRSNPTENAGDLIADNLAAMLDRQ